MLKNVLVSLVWIVAARTSDATSLSQEPTLVYRFDYNNTLSFSPDSISTNKHLASPDGKKRIAVDFKRIRVLADPDDALPYEFATRL